MVCTMKRFFFKDSRYLALFLLPLILVFGATFFFYAQGLTGALFYDDRSNLTPLEKIETFEEAWRFVREGSSGPLGRPIAQLSFLPHANGWPNTSIDARRVNVIIHLFNGVLLFVLGYMILRLRGQTDNKISYWIALGAATLWLVMPLLASTTLITVQRHTSLSILFGLMGLAVFVYGYLIQSQQLQRSILLQSLGLGLGTLLAIFTKESGALFPVYALLIDALLLQTLSTPKSIRWLRRGTLSLSLLVLLAYLSPLYQDWFSVNPFRGWSSFERLQTEVVLLWQYLYMTFFPQPTAFGPFHDDVTLVQGWLLPSLSAFGFVALTLIAFLIRKRTPWPLFALLWFFTGHLIESTVIHLELVFEHRNYLAIYGFCLALAAIAWQLPKRYARLGPALFTIYTLLISLILYGTTSIWGQPLVAAENWAKRHPQSSRAVAHLAEAYYDALGNISYVLPGLDQAAKNCSGCVDAKLQIMLYACGHTDEDDIQRRIDDLLHSAPTANASFSLLDSLYPTQELIALNACPPLTAADARQLTLLLLENPNYEFWEYRIHTLFHAAYFAKEVGDFEAAHAHLAEAEKLSPKTLPILQMQIHLLLKEHRYNEALAVIERRRSIERDRFMTNKVLDELESNVRETLNEFEASKNRASNTAS
jgi:protein O-mannosyl-transferase